MAEKVQILNGEKIRMRSALNGFHGPVNNLQIFNNQPANVQKSTNNEDTKSLQQQQGKEEYEETPTDILHFDVLEPTFRKLSIRDLCTVNKISELFEDYAQYIFRVAFSHLVIRQASNRGDIEIIVPRTKRLYFEYFRSIDELKNIFINFGSVIKSIDFSHVEFCKYSVDAIEELIAIYCSDDDSVLNKLIFRYLRPMKKKYLKHRLEKIYSRLTYLKIICIFSRNNKLLGSCRSLINLEISCFERYNMEECLFIKILKSNPQLKYLSFCSKLITLKMLRAIPVHAPGLNILRIRYYQTDRLIANQLDKLKQLKSLDLNVELNNVNDLFDIVIDENSPIEKLSFDAKAFDERVGTLLKKLNRIKKLSFMYNGEADIDLVETISQLKSLNYLYVKTFTFQGLDMKDIIKISDSAKNLQTLNCYVNEGVITESDFRAIVQKVKNRGNSVPLKLNVVYQKCKVDVPQYLMDEHRQWFEIDQRLLEGDQIHNI